MLGRVNIGVHVEKKHYNALLECIRCVSPYRWSFLNFVRTLVNSRAIYYGIYTWYSVKNFEEGFSSSKRWSKLKIQGEKLLIGIFFEDLWLDALWWRSTESECEVDLKIRGICRWIDSRLVIKQGYSFEKQSLDNLIFINCRWNNCT